MKHFVAMAALLTSLSAFAQLPYNPDANNDGHIGAFDLTSLLSVYSGGFSSGFLDAGTMMADFTYTTGGAYFSCYSSYEQPTTSWVVDGHLWSSSGLLEYSPAVTIDPVVNGTTIHFLIPPNGTWEISVVAVPLDSAAGYTSHPVMTSTHDIYKIVWWNGDWYTD